jgi:hypothetical protein
MNVLQITSFLHDLGFKQAVLLLYILLAAIFAGYNVLYLNHSLHVTTHHMGLNAPKHIRTVLKISIFFAAFTGIFSLLVLIVGWY